jgi:hypothetical protein
VITSFQLLVTNSSCDIQDDFKNAIKVCYAPYSESAEDTQSYLSTLAFRNYTDESA